ncbi:MAG: DUF418 domain-containing protein [Bacteroidales bacterium]|nr:DUF418 domain-containing protein [Bacteroidales bacterium]
MQEKIDMMNIQTQDTDLKSLPKAEPVQVQERIEVLDVIRGFALLGVLMANMAWFSSPALYFEILGKDMWTGAWDTTTSSFINLLVSGKFYSMFSFLFGLGFAIFFERAMERTVKPKLLFYRRLFILLLIGLAHAFFIWYGDILVTYALLGFLLPLFFNRKPKTLIKWAISLFSILILFLALVMGSLALGRMFNEAAITDSLQPFYADIESMIESSFHAYGQGTFAEIMAQRTSDTLFSFSQIFMGIFVIFPLFLLGLYAGKKKIFQNIESNLTSIRKIWIWSLVIGLTMSVVKFIFKNLMGADFYSFYTVIHTGSGFLGDIGLCLFFMTSIVLLYQNRKWMLKLKPLAYMGRMPLSNYLFQSIVCTTIFYSYGFGLYGKVGSALGLVLTVVIFTIQIFISKYWFKHYRFGPVEWVWRCLTYGKLFGMKLTEKNKIIKI